MKVGFSKKDITPKNRVTLQGLQVVRIMEEIESHIFANTFAMEHDGEQMVICSMDLCGYDKYFQELVFENIKSTDIDKDKIILCVTHTHSAPGVGDSGISVMESYLPEGRKIEEKPLPEDVTDNEKNRYYIAPIVAASIDEAWANRKDGYISPAFGRASIGHCRRLIYEDGSSLMYGFSDRTDFLHPEAGEDSGVELLYVFDSEKKPLGVLCNVACPSQVMEATKKLSADYWGKVRDYTEAIYGKDFTVVGICGAAGDQSPRDLVRHKRADFAAMDDKRKMPRRGDAYMYSEEGLCAIGKRLTHVIEDCMTEAAERMTNEAPFVNKVLELDLPVGKVTEAAYKEAKEKLKAYVENTPVLNDRYQVSQYTGILRRYDWQRKTGIYKIRFHIIRLADIAIATNPFELYLDYGLQIKGRSYAAQTFLIQLADMTAPSGYLSTPAAEGGGSYGVGVLSCATTPEGGKLLVEKTVAEINALF